MNIIHAFLLISFVLFEIRADQAAITTDGKKVVLLSNRTWRFAEASDQELFKNIDQNTNLITAEKTDKQIVDNLSAASIDKNMLSLIDIVKTDTTFDFRNVRWGMSKAQVLKTENAKQIKAQGEQLHYELEFLGYTCQVIYLFQKDRLFKAELKIKQDHVDPARYFKDYEDLKKYLHPIYGSSISDRNQWTNEMYSGDRTKWGFAVSIGFLNCRTTWKNTRSLVALNISGGNHQITTILEYSES